MATVSEDTKQIKVVGFYLTIVALALIFAMHKACSGGCEPSASSCRDEFISEGATTMACSQGAIAEVVTEPKKGILCHCKNNLQYTKQSSTAAPAASGSAHP